MLARERSACWLPLCAAHDTQIKYEHAEEKANQKRRIKDLLCPVFDHHGHGRGPRCTSMTAASRAS